jgi:hypothetical protein
MENIGEITIAILSQHRIIDQNLYDLDKTVEGDIISLKELFQTFQWNINKHMAVEEENLFTVADNTNHEEVRQLQNLMKDHKDLKEIIKNVAEEVEMERKPDTKILRELLSAHEGREINSFYPLLDKRLPVEKKKEILQGLEDVKLAG